MDSLAQTATPLRKKFQIFCHRFPPNDPIYRMMGLPWLNRKCLRGFPHRFSMDRRQVGRDLVTVEVERDQAIQVGTVDVNPGILQAL